MLEEAGRIVCDAATFEARGHSYSSHRGRKSESKSVKWVFGADGEYLFESGAYAATFDGRFLYCRQRGEDEVGIYDVWSFIQAEDRSSTRIGDGGNHRGAMARAMAMVPCGMTLLIASMRREGERWIAEMLRQNHATFEMGGTESVGNHGCTKITLHGEEQALEMAIWLDNDLGVIRKWQQGQTPNTMVVIYEQIHIDPDLPASTFKIPAKVIKEARKLGE